VQTPHALLLDFGGVLVEYDDEPDQLDPVVQRVTYLIAGLVPAEQVRANLLSADAERTRMRDASTEHRELTHKQLWQMVTDGWPEDARDIVMYDATELTRLWAYRASWKLRPGIQELLEYTLGTGMPVAVVSNTRSGAAHRQILEEFGLAGAFSAQIYSDELGWCKPHPKMVLAACEQLEVQPADCWLVGDEIATDIQCGRDAGVGATILMRTGPTEDGGPLAAAAAAANGAAPADAAPNGPVPTPDAVVPDGHVLLALVKGIRLAASRG
jgi:HAD superfamily hydrolase (TIGR01549 family)